MAVGRVSRPAGSGRHGWSMRRARRVAPEVDAAKRKGARSALVLTRSSAKVSQSIYYVGRTL